MGLFDRIFPKKTPASAVKKAENKIFECYGVRPSDDQRVKARFYLCIAGSAFFNHFTSRNNNSSDSVRRAFMDWVTADLTQSVKGLTVIAGNIVDGDDEIRQLESVFSANISLNASTKMDGAAAFQGLYHYRGDSVMNDILNHTGGPFGITGYAAIVVGDGIFGIGKSKEHFIELMNILNQFSKDLSNTL